MVLRLGQAPPGGCDATATTASRGKYSLIDERESRKGQSRDGRLYVQSLAGLAKSEGANLDQIILSLPVSRTQTEGNEEI